MDRGRAGGEYQERLSKAMDEPRSYFKTLVSLWQAGLRYGGIIDAGCADGVLCVALAENGPGRGSTILNIDAQDEYSESLAEIQATLGGHFRICAVGERDGGTIDLYRGEHAYWSSVRPAGDRYWGTLNNMVDPQPVKVPLRTFDSLVEETALPPPYLLKLDIQGAEAAALAGAPRTLAGTSVVAVEMMLEDFTDIHAALAQNGFDLFDLTDLSYTHTGALGWFYAVYLNVRFRSQRISNYWDPAMNEDSVALQYQRREEVRRALTESLQRYRAGQWPELPA
jgi:FkbM family methyltransferase